MGRAALMRDHVLVRNLVVVRNHKFISTRVVRAFVRAVPALMGASALGCAHRMGLVHSWGSANTAAVRRTALMRTRSFVATAFIIMIMIRLVGDCR